jgi:hypothetical protein
MYTAAEIVRAINFAHDLLQRNNQVGDRKYPHEYFADDNTPKNIGTVDRNALLEFPLIGGPSAGGFAYGTPQNTDSKGDAGPPGTDRVIFSVCFQFAAVMTHKVLDESQLGSCYEVDAIGRPINSPGVPGSNLNPPRPIGPILNLPQIPANGFPAPLPVNPNSTTDGVGAVGGAVGFIPEAGPDAIDESAQGGTVGEIPLNLIPGGSGPGPFKKAEAAPAA